MSTTIKCECGWEGEYSEYKLKHRLEVHNEKHDFACSCGEEGKADCNEKLAWALDYLSHRKDGELRPVPTTMENFLTNVVAVLEWEYKASIEGMPFDQWGRIDVRGHQYEGLDPFSTHVQCDSFEHGLALTLWCWHERFGDGRPWPSENDDEPDA